MQIGKEMAIPSILKIGNGALGKIGGYLKTEGLDQVVLFFGNGLIDMFGELVMNSLKEADVNVLEYNELDTVDIDDIITLAFAIPKGGDLYRWRQGHRCRKICGISAEPSFYQCADFQFKRRLFQCQRIPSGAGKAYFCPCQTGLWHYRGYPGDPYRSGEVHLLRHRRYDFQDHGTL